ncbi:molybdenum cofactor biosysynthesis protein, partial [Amaricoccus sp. HAR-UPW-R2A-40]
AANPDTGVIDADTLGALRAGWGAQEFGVYAEVIAGGRVTLGDRLQ